MPEPVVSIVAAATIRLMTWLPREMVVSALPLMPPMNQEKTSPVPVLSRLSRMTGSTKYSVE